MQRPSVWARLVLSFVTLFVLASPAFSDSFTLIRIGDKDGFGYGTAAGFLGADGNAANKDGANILATGDLLPDINQNGTLATGNGDDFDLRSAAEVAGNYVTGSGFTNAASTGSEYTDISLSTSFDTSKANNRVLVGTNPNVFGPGGPFPGDGNPNTLSNQPGFLFSFFVSAADIVQGSTLFFNMVFGDYDVTPATIKFTRANGTFFTQAVTTQPANQDGQIKSAFVSLVFADVFTAGSGGWDGYLKVDFNAPNEPYTAFDYVEINLDQIPLQQVPESQTILLLGMGLFGLAVFGARGRF